MVTCALWWQLDCFHKPGVDSLSLSLSLSFFLLGDGFRWTGWFEYPFDACQETQTLLKYILYRHIMLCVEDPSNHWMVQSQAEACDDTLTDFGVCVFRRVRKIAKSDYRFSQVCLSVCLSARPQGTTRPPHWTDLHETRYLSIFRKPVVKIVSLKSDRNNGYFTRGQMHIFDHISPSSS